MERGDEIRTKRALLHTLDDEVAALVGTFLSEEQQLRLRSLNDEIYRLEGELIDLGAEL